VQFSGKLITDKISKIVIIIIIIIIMSSYNKQAAIPDVSLEVQTLYQQVNQLLLMVD